MRSPGGGDAFDERGRTGFGRATRTLKGGAVLARFVGPVRPARVNPAEHGAVGHVAAALGQPLQDARGRQGVAQLPTHGHPAHSGWPAGA
jgi:hypothetical protein